MKILLVNDDGINHKNIHVLEKSLSKMNYQLTTVAPVNEQSAKSMSMSLGKIKYLKVSENQFGVYGTPIDCINFAINALNLKIDLVISGVNHGLNLGSDIMYSGTVGACFQAFKYKIPSIAISSMEKNENDLFKDLNNIFEIIFDKKLFSQEYVLNINIPYDTSKSQIIFTNPNNFESKISGTINSKEFTFKREIIIQEAQGTDIYEVQNNNISISKLRLNYSYQE